MSKDCKISFETALEILQNPVFGNETEHQGAIKFVSEAFNMSEDAVLEEIENNKKSDDNSSKKEKLTEEEQGFIDVVELALDWSLPVSDEDYKKYEELIKRRATLNNN